MGFFNGGYRPTSEEIKNDGKGEREGARSPTFTRILLARLTVMSRYLRRFQTTRKSSGVRALPLMKGRRCVCVSGRKVFLLSAKNRASCATFLLCTHNSKQFERNAIGGKVELA